MFGQIIQFYAESRAVRHFTGAGLLIIAGGVLAAQLVATALDSAPSGLVGSFRPSDAAASREVARAPTPMRSVLDDEMSTGSLTSRAASVTLDPCTGARR